MACRRSAVRSRLAPPLKLETLYQQAGFGFTASPSSRGLGHYPFTVATGVRIPVGTPLFKQTGLGQPGPVCFCAFVRRARVPAAKRMARDAGVQQLDLHHTRIASRRMAL